MTRHIIFIDLDRTLFDTPKFMQAAWQAVGQECGVDGTAPLADLEQWYTAHGALRFYAFDKHVAAVTGRPALEVIEAIKPTLATQNFLYPDYTAVFDWPKSHEVRILSFGEEWLQRYKLGFTPQLDALPAHIILEPKGEFIKTHFHGTHGWLVDDKRGEILPTGYRELWLNRQNTEAFSQKDGILTINSLTSVMEVL